MRKRPENDESRLDALTEALVKNQSLAEGVTVLNPATVIRLEATQPDLEAKMLLRFQALNNQTAATASINPKKEKARMYISHFIQVFNLGVAREVYPASARTFFHLDVSSSAVPDLSTNESILSWGNRIQVGDPLRTTGGGAAMSNPTLAQFNTAFNDYKSATTAHSTLKDAYDAAAKAVSELREDVDDLIFRIWNEVETYYSEETPSNKRKLAREWGVKYINLSDDNSMEGTVTDINNNPVAGAVINIEQLSLAASSNSNGEYSFGVIAPGTYTIKVTKTGFQEKTIPTIVIEAGITTSLDVQLIATTGSLSGLVTYNNQPLAGVTISIDSLSLSVTTGQDGTGIINNVSPGTYVVTISKPNFVVQTFTGIIINAGSTTSINANLVSTTGTLVANVYSQGQPLGGATVRIDSLDMQVITGPDGIGRLEAIPPNTYSVTASAPNKVTITYSITINANETASLTFDLQPVS